MKWLGEDPNLLNLSNQSVQTAHGHNPPRTQDDAMIGYVFQRGTGEQPEFPPGNVPIPGKIPTRWALGNEELVQVCGLRIAFIVFIIIITVIVSRDNL